MKKLFLVFGIAIILSCAHKAEHVEKAFYYWKTAGFNLSGSEDSLVRNGGIQKLYVKFFEIENHPVMGNIPVAKSGFYFYSDSVDKMKIVPTVFIRNGVFKKSSEKDLDLLADNINFLIRKYARHFNGDSIREYQMDCDWTKSTQRKYFYFLKSLKKVSGREISCTLRLYPFKYPDIMGIPPVDRATLMCYNLVNPLENKSINSILDERELKSYLNARKYPIHLDVALPAYSWMQVYQNNRFARMINIIPEGFTDMLKPIKPLWYESTSDVVVENFFIRKGDRIKIERVSAVQMNRAIDIIKKNVALDDAITVSLFHLDGRQLSQYTNEEINHFYAAFTE